ncbi:TrbC/VirB2 family protein [Noviherbaspirillum sp.]|jgi:type IV secretion system protein VirB2|uniref:TrbC/VirB2 family protein n=1 Tax=Noviherbaspirillum sp. TaxID=1926288 RepID=UPI0025FD31BE|nr:TrbC/VirB2 family protein [Noviherbaspirillum sp.]
MKNSVSFKTIQTAAMVGLLLALAMPELAQAAGAGGGLDVGKDLLTQIASWLDGLGVLVVTIALMVVGFRMAFQAAEWKDVAPVFWGGVLIGGAATVAGLFVGK